MSEAEELREMFSFLEGRSFQLARMSYSERNFGNCVLQWNSSVIRIAVSMDRGDFSIDVGDGHSWYALEDVESYLQGSPPSESWVALTPEGAKSFLTRNLDDISSLFREKHKRAAFVAYEGERVSLRKQGLLSPQ